MNEKNIYIELEDCYLLKVKYKDTWCDSYIDKESYEKVSSRVWRTNHKKNKVYLVSGSVKTNNSVYLHNFIMNHVCTPKFEVDHLDGNSLNNRISNLKIVTRQENVDNTRVRIDNKIGIRGVCQNNKNKLYKCDFSYHKKRFYFKDFKTVEEAVYCRKYAEEYFGIETLSKNPLAKKYLTLSEEQSSKIKEYVHSKISGN